MTWTYFNPVHIIFSGPFDVEIESLLKKEKDTLVICSDRFRNSEAFIKISDQLSNFRIFTDIENNPSLESCQLAIDFVKTDPPHTIVAIGGGSVIDTAKAARMAIYKSCYDIKELFKFDTEVKHKPLFVAIPTTHGSSSEVTMWATIWDKTNNIKHSLSEPDNYPDYAIYDAELCASLPMSVSISSTLDTLSHSLETLWNKNTNPVSNSLSIEAIQLIVNNADNLVDPVSSQTRQDLLLASMLSGLAFSNTKTAAAHSISYPLSAYFDIPHGIACAMPLRPLWEINMKEIGNQWSDLLQRTHLSGSDEFWEKVSIIVRNKIPFALHEYGVKDDDLEWILELASTKDRMENNIVDLNKEDIKEILKKIY